MKGFGVNAFSCLLRRRRKKCTVIGKSCQNKSLAPKPAPAPSPPPLDWIWQNQEENSFKGRDFWEERLQFNITRQFAILTEYYNTWHSWESWNSPEIRDMKIVHSDFALILSWLHFWFWKWCGARVWQGFIDFGTSQAYFVRIREKCLK